jgi:hypothetical protein
MIKGEDFFQAEASSNPITVLVIEYCNLKFICDLMLVI